MHLVQYAHVSIEQVLTYGYVLYGVCVQLSVTTCERNIQYLYILHYSNYIVMKPATPGVGTSSQTEVTSLAVRPQERMAAV